MSDACLMDEFEYPEHWYYDDTEPEIMPMGEYLDMLTEFEHARLLDLFVVSKRKALRLNDNFLFRCYN